ncbi:MAG: 6-hydroxymethylpterin diphosphokinase MptE-like protein [Anaerolineales bacterium]
MTLRQSIKKITPTPVWKLGSDTYWWWHNRGRHLVAKSLDSRWAESTHRLRQYENMHANQRCFIIGNGPSLRQTDLNKLRGEYTFGLNRIYLLYPELGFTTTYLVSVNDLVLEQCAPEMKSLSLPKFFTWRARRWFRPDHKITYLDTDFTGQEDFCSNITGRFFEGYTVTYVALQLAFQMGFSEAILVGVDHNFVTKGTANQAIVSQGDDPNHFAPNYFGKGFKWQLPDLAGSERAYQLAQVAYSQAGRRVVDATIGGKLTIFPKVDYATLF